MSLYIHATRRRSVLAALIRILILTQDSKIYAELLKPSRPFNLPGAHAADFFAPNSDAAQIHFR